MPFCGWYKHVSCDIMKTIPKPKHCRQNWLEMTPTEGGRICRQCDKIIVDFSKMSWIEIENLQRENYNALCGMYNPRQLDYWGQAIPNHKDSLLKIATITGLTISLSLPTIGQTINTSDSIVIKGKVIDQATSEELPFANISLRSRKVAAVTDIEGNFKLVIKNVPSTALPDTLEVKYVGYITKLVVFKDLNEVRNTKSDILLNGIKLELSPSVNTGTAFYVTKPTLGQSIKWKFKKWF